MTVFYIGPESSTYHTRRNCPALTKSTRYWPVSSAKNVEAISQKRHERATRRLCRLCERASR